MHNLPGRRVSIEEIVAHARRRARSSFDDVRAARSPRRLDSASFDGSSPGFAETPLADGVRPTIDRFRALLAEGLVQPPLNPDQGA